MTQSSAIVGRSSGRISLPETAGHPAQQWPVDERGERAVLCGVCTTTLTIPDYLEADSCPDCGAAFNPGSKLHTELYFMV
jgi:uncharacterized CHY-type Zn-finger protein